MEELSNRNQKTSVSVKWTSAGSRWVRATAIVSGKIYSRTKYVTVSSPLSGGSVSASTSTSICAGTDPGTINSSVSASGGSGSISYQWQKTGGLVKPTLEGGSTTWTNISGASGSSYNPPAISTITQYRKINESEYYTL